MTTRQTATAAQPRADLSADSTALVARQLLGTPAKQLAETPSSMATRHVTTATQRDVDGKKKGFQRKNGEARKFLCFSL
jgi:hypothetical protein